MKWIRKITLILLLAAMGAFMTSCFGAFQLTRNVYSWNESVTPNKFAQTLLFYGMNIVPVYGAATFLDFFVFNLVEFWSGSNPIAMAEHEHETQLVEVDGQWYEMHATKNHFTVSAMEDGSVTETLYTIQFDELTHQFIVKANTEEQ